MSTEHLNICLSTKTRSIGGTEIGLFYLPPTGDQDVLLEQKIDYSTYHSREVWVYCQQKKWTSIYHWREVRMHCRHREWNILLTTGGKSGCTASTENGLFYLPLEGSQDALLVQRMDYSTLIPLEGSMDVLLA